MSGNNRGSFLGRWPLVRLPNGWALSKIGDILVFNYGKALPASDRAPGPYLVYGSNGVVGTHSSAITDAPAIIIGRKGSIGEIHYSNEPCFPIDTTYFIDDFRGLDPLFLNYA